MERALSSIMKKALFLDRDGVINIEKNYLYKIEEFEFVDGIFEICKYFQDRGYEIVIITNQSGIARGFYSEDDFLTLNSWMLREFERNGIEIATVKYCPHHPDFNQDCECRKPNPGMIIEASKELDINLENSILIGDKISDIEAGKRAGIGINILIKRDNISLLKEII